MSRLKSDIQICVVGLGYVGLPLSVLLSTKFKVIGLDVTQERVDQLNRGFDCNGEFLADQLNSNTLSFISNIQDAKSANFYIIAVPTPIDEFKLPDLSLLLSACEDIATVILKGDTVVIESTVYPGVTEDICIPSIEKSTGLKLGTDFFVGYSPERVNPGDKFHSIENVTKLISASDDETLLLLERVYGAVIKAGLHKCASIRVAEAAKAIENTQRDLNIALVNEFSKMFHLMGVSTKEVLSAASTKWNFLNFSPGLVGGHCLGVDPYYLTFKAQEVGYDPEVILAGRNINDSMGTYVAQKTIGFLKTNAVDFTHCKVLVAGLTFKENVADSRNSRVADVVSALESAGVDVETYDPVLEVNDFATVKKNGPYHAIVIAVDHAQFYQELTFNFCIELSVEKPIIVDVKGMLSPTQNEVIKNCAIYFSL